MDKFNRKLCQTRVKIQVFKEIIKKILTGNQQNLKGENAYSTETPQIPPHVMYADRPATACFLFAFT
jgi:hypothetical protein